MVEFHKATKLSEVARVVDLTPLESGDPRYADVSAGRGGSDDLAQLKACLLENDARDNRFAKIAFSGHRGCGKSTELLRLEHQLSDRFTTLHLTADESLLQDYDYTYLFLWLVDGLVNQFKGAGMPLDERLVDDVAKWFAEVTQEKSESITSEVGLETETKAGAKAGFFGVGIEFFAKLKSRVLGSTESRHRFKRTLQRYSFELINRVNDLLGNAQTVLGAHGKPIDLLIVVDNLDRLPPEASASLFFVQGEQLKAPRAHMIYTVPIATVLAPNTIGKVFENRFTLAMVKVRNDTASVNQHGVDALEGIVANRVEIDKVFGKRQDVRELARMSGGNIRDLMRLLQNAQRIAIVDEKQRIDSAAVKRAVKRMRLEYEQLLLPGWAYYPLLAQIHLTKSDGAEPVEDADPEKVKNYREFFTQFLFNGSVLEYNGERMWYDVHPVIQQIDAFKKALAHVESATKPEAEE